MKARTSSPLLGPLLLLASGSWMAGGCGDSGTSTAPDVSSFGGSAGTGGSSGAQAVQPLTTTVPDPNKGGASGADLFECGSGECVPDRAESCSEGAGEEPIEPADLAFACRLELSDDELLAVCKSAGSGKLDTPCISTSDCGAGLACVGGGLVGRCRPYCCRSDSCDGMPRTYCSPEPERESDPDPEREPLIVPVCVAADDCDLGETYPCPSGRTCECGEDQACMVVRAGRDGESVAGTGLTSCVEPGEGEAGDPCPCAWGHVCSKATGTCLELCSTVAADAACSTRCQASSELPLGWGVCVGE